MSGVASSVPSVAVFVATATLCCCCFCWLFSSRSCSRALLVCAIATSMFVCWAALSIVVTVLAVLDYLLSAVSPLPSPPHRSFGRCGKDILQSLWGKPVFSPLALGDFLNPIEFDLNAHAVSVLPLDRAR